LSQLNRAAEQREGHRPRMSDLRESGSIEQDADVVALLHREDYYHKDDPEWVADNPEKMGVAEVILTKQRNGPTGVVKLAWISQSTKFRDYSPSHPPVSYHEPKVMPAPPREQAAGYPRPRASAPPPFEPGHGASGSSGHSASSGYGSFAPGPKTGPIENHRDGGGPDREIDDDEDFDGIPI
jgi:hypothetical protein